MKSERGLTGTVLLSAILGWLVPSLAVFAIFATLESVETSYAGQTLGIGFIIILGSLPTTLISTATLGVLWHKHASKHGLTRKLDYWRPGLLIGAVVATVMPIITLPLISVTWVNIFGVVYGAACGAMTGLYAWLTLRPDQAVMANPVQEEKN